MYIDGNELIALFLISFYLNDIWKYLDFPRNVFLLNMLRWTSSKIGLAEVAKTIAWFASKMGGDELIRSISSVPGDSIPFLLKLIE